MYPAAKARVVFAGIVVWQLIGDFLVDKWEDWRWGDWRWEEELPALPARSSSMPARGSFAALVEAEHSARQTRD